MATGSKTTINVRVPSSWDELSNARKAYVFRLLSRDVPVDEIKALCFIRWSGFKVLAPYDDKFTLVKFDKQWLRLKPEMLAQASSSLNWMDTPPPAPSPISKYRLHHCLNPYFNGVPFEKFLYLDNLYQGIIAHQNQQMALAQAGQPVDVDDSIEESLLTQMTSILYRFLGNPKCHPKYINLNTLYWWTSLKLYFAGRFPHLFQPTANQQNALENPALLGQKLQASMDAQIRILTKGDVTKEKAILKLDTVRALTELDALCKESEEIKAKTKTN